ncbi:MAG: hypothetical protein HYR83_09505 [Planctomycetes bacterium]|nr:hypothetical protein [Planctomycetota bacterium]
MEAFGASVKSRGILATLAACLLVSGCAQPSGSWSLAETEPKGSSFPISAMTIDESGKYQARGFFTPDGEFRNEPQESSGKFKSTVLGTQLKPETGPLSYTVSRRWDGRMAVSYVPPGKSKRVTAIFSPSSSEKKTGKVEPFSASQMKLPSPESESPIKADPELSYDSGTRVKLPG